MGHSLYEEDRDVVPDYDVLASYRYVMITEGYRSKSPHTKIPVALIGVKPSGETSPISNLRYCQLSDEVHVVRELLTLSPDPLDPLTVENRT